MSCDQAQQRLLDEVAPRPADLEAHLAGCPACQDFARAQAAALRLQGVEAAPARRLPLERVRQRAAALGALALVVLGAGGWWGLQRPAARDAAMERGPAAERARPGLEVADRATAEAPALERAPGRLEVPPSALAEEAPAVEGRLEVSALEVAPLQALAELTRQVHASARVNPQVHDASYRPFGALPTWLALKTTPPIRSLGGAVSPLVYSLEE